MIDHIIRTEIFPEASHKKGAQKTIVTVLYGDLGRITAVNEIVESFRVSFMTSHTMRTSGSGYAFNLIIQSRSRKLPLACSFAWPYIYQ